MNRRSFLKGSGLAAAGALAHAQNEGRLPGLTHKAFTLAFFTDVHIEPELDAAQGTELAFDRINASDAELAICGGDHVFDALSTKRDRVIEQFNLYRQVEKHLRIPVRHVLGNHDVVGLSSESGISSHDGIHGKRLFEQAFHTPTYYFFRYRDVCFIVLDSILITGHEWKPEIDQPQLAWLERALAYNAGWRKIVISHVPLATSLGRYCPGSDSKQYEPVRNSHQVIPLLEKHNVLAVLQGHTHVVETVSHHGIQYITGGSVCGNWWRGTHFGDHEGFTLVTVDGDSVTSRYEPTGFISLDPKNT
jgi:Icc protein